MNHAILSDTMLLIPADSYRTRGLTLLDMHVGLDGLPTNVPEWTHISHNLIMNGPTIGHTSSLFPFIDNDDGSAAKGPHAVW